MHEPFVGSAAMLQATAWGPILEEPLSVVSTFSPFILKAVSTKNNLPRVPKKLLSMVSIHSPFLLKAVSSNNNLSLLRAFCVAS